MDYNTHALDQWADAQDVLDAQLDMYRDMAREGFERGEYDLEFFHFCDPSDGAAIVSSLARAKSDDDFLRILRERCVTATREIDGNYEPFIEMKARELREAAS